MQRVNLCAVRTFAHTVGDLQLHLLAIPSWQRSSAMTLLKVLKGERPNVRGQPPVNVRTSWQRPLGQATESCFSPLSGGALFLKLRSSLRCNRAARPARPATLGGHVPTYSSASSTR